MTSSGIFSGGGRVRFKARLVRCLAFEVQKRGARHWHVVLSVPAGVHAVAISMLWWDALRKQGKMVFSPPYTTKNGTWNITSVSSLMALPGAYEHSCNVQANGSRGAWLRYMQDHASKGKQDQIGVAKGRHWGIIGRKLYSRAVPVSTAELSDSSISVFACLSAFVPAFVSGSVCFRAAFGLPSVVWLSG